MVAKRVGLYCKLSSLMIHVITLRLHNTLIYKDLSEGVMSKMNGDVYVG